MIQGSATSPKLGLSEVSSAATVAGWLLLPGALLMLVGLLIAIWILPGPRTVGGITFDVHTLLYAAVMVLLGVAAEETGSLPGDEIDELVGLLGDRILPEHAHISIAGVGQHAQQSLLEWPEGP